MTSSRLLAAGWAALAAAGLALACWAATWPEESRDFWEVRAWLEAWAHGPYQQNTAIDYPPHGLLLLAPLAWLPGGGAALIYAAINAAICVAAAWLLVSVTAHLSNETLSAQDAVTCTCMIASWGAVRSAVVLGQTAPLALVLLLLATRGLGGHGAAWPGLGFGLGSYKINLLAGFGLLPILERRWRVFPVAALVVVAMTVAFAAVSGKPATSAVAGYLGNLRYLYTGEDFMFGSMEIRPLLHDLVPIYRLAEALNLLLSVGSLVAIIVFGRRVLARGGPAAEAVVFAGALCWSLFALFNNRFNGVLLAPAFLLVMWGRAGRWLGAWRMRVVAGFLAFQVADVPLLLRWVIQWLTGWRPFTAAYAASYTTRLLTAAVLSGCLYEMWRLGREARRLPA